MDIKPFKPSLSQEASAAFHTKSGFSDLPSLMSQFTIRTMGGDLKNAALQTAAKLTAAKTVSPPATPRGERKELYGVTPTPYLKIFPPPILPATSQAPEPAKIPSWPPKEIVEPKTVPITAPPLPKTEDEQAKKAKEAQKKQEQEQKAAEQAAKEAQKKLELEKKTSQALAATAAKEAARVAKEKLIQAREAQEQEWRDIFERAKLKLAAKEFNAAMVDAQKIVASPATGWLATWRAKRLINKAQKEITKKESAPREQFYAAAPALPPIPTPIAAPPKPTPTDAMPRGDSPVGEKFYAAAPPKTEAIPRDERSEFYGAPPEAVPINLPTVDEIPSIKPDLPISPAPTPPTPPTPPMPKPVSPAAPTPDEQLFPTTPREQFYAAPPAPAKPSFQMPVGLASDLLETPASEPAEILDMKKIALVGLVGIAILALIIGGLWYFLKQPQPPAQVTQSPSPVPSLATQTPLPAPTSLFRADSQKVFELKIGQTKANFQEALAQLAQTDEPVGTLIFVLFKDNQGLFLSLAEIASSTAIDLFDLPTQASAGPLKNQLNLNSFSFFAYSQAQADSSPFTAQANTGRPGLIVSIKNSTSTSTEDLTKSLKDLEQLMLADLTILLPGAKNNLPARPVFLDNTYNNVAIRYVNLPEPNLSLDYAILNNMLIFATSRESMYAIIDRLLLPATNQPSLAPTTP